MITSLWSVRGSPCNTVPPVPGCVAAAPRSVQDLVQLRGRWCVVAAALRGWHRSAAFHCCVQILLLPSRRVGVTSVQALTTRHALAALVAYGDFWHHHQGRYLPRPLDAAVTAVRRALGVELDADDGFDLLDSPTSAREALLGSDFDRQDEESPARSYGHGRCGSG